MCWFGFKYAPREMISTSKLGVTIVCPMCMGTVLS